MKLQLDEHTLNLYLNKAINEEVNELFGSRNNNVNTNLLGTLATDINKFEQLLNIAEQGIGLNSKPTQPGNKIKVLGGGFDFVNTTRRNLLTAVEILSGFADRVSNIEQKLGINALMENAAGLSWSPALGDWVMGAKTTPASVVRTANMVSRGVSFAKFLTNPYVWIAAAATIVTHCVLVGRSKKKQRDIVRVSNCLQVLANRMKNVLEYFAKKAGVQNQTGQQAQGTQQPVSESIFNGMNGNKAANYIPNISKGMAELSSLMKQLYSGQLLIEMPQSLSTSAEIKQFQNWANAHEYVDQDGLALVPDGKWGRRTAYVYDQVAANLSQQQTSQTQVNENKLIKEGQFDRALANLEQKVGVTGTGGAAYANVNNMSGAAGGASRLQNSENGYSIAATYPKVLNQYLAKLHDLGFNTGNLQPLPETGKKRFYSKRTLYNDGNLQQIQTRINELLNIIHSAVKSNDTNVVLPPKPVVRRQNPTSQEVAAPEVPELNNDFKIEDPEIDIPDMKPLDASQQEPVKTISYPDANGKLDANKEKNFIDNVIDAMRGLNKNDSVSLQIKKMGIENAYRNALAIVDKIVQEGSMTREQAIAEKKKLKYYYKQFKSINKSTIQGNGATAAQAPAKEPAPSVVNEAMFKKLVKQIIRESLMNK